MQKASLWESKKPGKMLNSSWFLINSYCLELHPRYHKVTPLEQMRTIFSVLMLMASKEIASRKARKSENSLT